MKKYTFDKIWSMSPVTVIAEDESEAFQLAFDEAEWDYGRIKVTELSETEREEYE